MQNLQHLLIVISVLLAAHTSAQVYTDNVKAGHAQNATFTSSSSSIPLESINSINDSWLANSADYAARFLNYASLRVDSKAINSFY